MHQIEMTKLEKQRVDIQIQVNKQKEELQKKMEHVENLISENNKAREVGNQLEGENIKLEETLEE